MKREKGKVPGLPRVGKAMEKKSYWLLAILIVIAMGALMISYFLKPQVDLIPRKVLFGNPVYAAPALSPDGKQIAYLAPHNEILNVWVRSVDKEDAHVVTSDRERGIRQFFWAANGSQILYLQDFGGDENWHLYGADLGSGETRDFTPFDKVQVQVLEHDKHFPNEVLLAINKDNPALHDVYHLDLTSGDLKVVVKNPGNVAQWIVDRALKVRGAVSSSLDGGFELFIRDDERSDWKKIVSWGAQDALASSAVGFSKSGDEIYLLDSRQVNTARLVKMEVGTGKIGVIAEDPQYDVSSVMINPDTYEIEAASFRRERLDYQIIAPKMKDEFSEIAKFHNGDFSVTSRDDADEKWVVQFVSDAGPVSFYVYDRQSKEATFLFDHMPELNRYLLAPMEPVSLKARDGLMVHGYMVLPIDRPHKNLPLVLNVHGGPWHRDVWGYDAQAQWLANRGYAVLEINYRGSTGYGKAFLNAGDKEWGGKMHDDLIDAVQWAIDRGVADPTRIAIYGGSYGGYAALVGATFTPERFRCAVDIVGPSNLVSFIRTIPPYWSSFLASLHNRVGNPDTEEEFLKSRSPLFKVDQIRIPMLIVQGANDPRVKKEESEQIVAALKEKGIEHQYLLFPDEGHGFAKPQNRMKFYGEAEKFLAKCLGGRYEEPDDGPK